MSEITVKINDEVWTPENDNTAKYDAIHAAAGAILAGAEQVTVVQSDE
jgi:hypothetical protein